jgi:hypothetical protein
VLRSPWALVLASYGVVFALLLARLLVASPAAFGRGNNPVDSRLLAWTQAAVAQKLLVAPNELFDAPIFHPAPAQLAGAENFLSSQVVFAPVFWLSGNAVLAANALIVLSFPLAAFAMERLLASLGASRLVAWAVGLLFALGPLAVPANIQLTQYLILYLPLVALTTRRLRTDPSWRRAAELGGAYLLAVFSSYYMAALATLVLAVWLPLELARPNAGRTRFLVRAGVVAVAVGALLVWFSQPYIERRADALDVFALRSLGRSQPPVGVSAPDRSIIAVAPASVTPSVTPSSADPVAPAGGDRPRPWPPLWVRLAWPPLVDVSLLLSAVGLVAIGSRSAIARRLAVRGAVVAGLGVAALLSFLSGALTPLPTPLAFFRNPFRLTAVTGFGVALLAAAALEATRARLGTRRGAAVTVVMAAILLATRGRELVSPTLDPVAPLARDAAAYREIGAFAALGGGGPLLELPVDGARRDALLTDSMVASTIHGLPLVTGFGPVFPLHWPLIARAIDRLPRPDGLQELVDLTGLRWVLLRPASDWPRAEVRAEMARVLAQAGADRFESDGYLLQRIDLPPRHPEWAAALGRGYRHGQSLLGTPYAIRPPASFAGTITAPAEATTTPGALLELPVEIRNRSTWTWPGVLSPNGGVPGEIFVAARWWPRGDAAGGSGDGGRSALAGIDLGLRRDLPAGEALAQALVLPAPAIVGAYDLGLRLAQRGSAPEQGARRSSDAVVAVSVGSP